MRFLYALALSALASFGDAAAITQGNSTSSEPTYDAIIIGGGPAGLSALSGLARVRRKVLLIDSGEYRNAPTRHMHDVIGFDGVTPAYYRWAARGQLSHYDTVSMVNGTVTKIVAQQNNTWFSVSANYANETKTLSTKKIVLATGLKDILPETPGIEENWGKGIYWCPWCDGHEHADQPLGLLASLDKIPGLVREILTLNRDIVAFVNGTDTSKSREIATKDLPKWEAYLKIHNVTVDNRTITDIQRLREGTTGHEDPSLPTAPENDLFEVNFNEGQSVHRAAFLTSFEDEQRSRVPEELGVRLYGGRLAADSANGLVTNIPGVYAIGDANSDNVTNVPHALFSGKRTAVFLHVRLERETQADELAEVDDEPEKRDIHLKAREVWERVNGQPGDLLYAGDFDQ
ncbi:hypothetical protein BGZ61DRAFT_364474 [Ilyonectria robusta]|uniref:uncharacterized protein n=1 Tax=Ilyonectria robusta TaxID=1079257 RepID=UPI001E8E8344|nr:uncharacterized protein BGZ61DRAFT_364474 [Ilyonectria robusta]KAH8669432.1 hypothetical protein BGZ61DRAFT_364474 [Ilyonectria robusta]